MIIDNDRNKLPLKIMYRCVNKISLISSKFFEYNTQFVLTDIEKYKVNPSTIFRAMINLPSRVANLVVFYKQFLHKVKFSLFAKLLLFKNYTIDVFDILNLKYS